MEERIPGDRECYTVLFRSALSSKTLRPVTGFCHAQIEYLVHRKLYKRPMSDLAFKESDSCRVKYKTQSVDYKPSSMLTSGAMVEDADS